MRGEIFRRTAFGIARETEHPRVDVETRMLGAVFPEQPEQRWRSEDGRSEAAARHIATRASEAGLSSPSAMSSSVETLSQGATPVSYTHLTLPTILLV